MRTNRSRNTREQAITRLRTAFKRNSLCLYIGRGRPRQAESRHGTILGLTVFLNSLRLPGQMWPTDVAINQAVGEWWFAQNRVPLDIVARELRLAFNGRIHALGKSVTRSPIYSKGRLAQPDELLKSNETLAAIVSLCRNTKPGTRGLRSIVTYNLDGLLELALGTYPFQSMRKQKRGDAGRLPIYHVHGYIQPGILFNRAARGQPLYSGRNRPH